jgi:hypothetical protein
MVDRFAFVSFAVNQLQQSKIKVPSATRKRIFVWLNHAGIQLFAVKFLQNSSLPNQHER